MLRASSLYIVVIIAFVIALICSSLIAAALFFQNFYQQKFRIDRLHDNLESGINILLASDSVTYYNREKLRLFDNDADSLQLSRVVWGVFDMGVVQSFTSSDTLYKTFLIAAIPDSSKWSALYLIDENRPVSVSGNTAITGNVYLPKAGIRAAYVDNNAYKGDSRFVSGHIFESTATLPPPNEKRLNDLYMLMSQIKEKQALPLSGNNMVNSFLNPVRKLKLKKDETIHDIKLKGNLIIYSDTTIFIDSTASIDNILIFAKSIVIGNHFKGRCQLFASDSISVGEQCHLFYPSTLGTLRVAINKKQSAPVIQIGKKSIIQGIVFNCEQEKHEIPSTIALESHAKIYGQVYAQGNVSIQDSVEFNGNLTARKLLYKTTFSMYENYLINVKINSRQLSPYYLTTDLLPTAGKTKKIMLWMDEN